MTEGLDDIAHVDPWTTSFNPGTTTLERLVELAHEVDFAAFVFAKDDWTTAGASAASPDAGQAAPQRTMSRHCCGTSEDARGLFERALS
jgi:hypothetical protein